MSGALYSSIINQSMHVINKSEAALRKVIEVSNLNELASEP